MWRLLTRDLPSLLLETVTSDAAQALADIGYVRFGFIGAFEFPDYICPGIGTASAQQS